MALELITYYQANRTRVEVRIVRRDIVGPDMESLTYWSQVNRTILAMRRDTVGPDMEPLTRCQANKTIVAVETGSEKDTA